MTESVRDAAAPHPADGEIARTHAAGPQANASAEQPAQALPTPWLADQGRGSWPVYPMAAAGLVCLALAIAFDPALPTVREWQIAGLLGAVAVVAAVIRWYFGPADDAVSPPWSVHTIWLLPAALLLPPVGYLPLVAFSIASVLWRRAHSLTIRTAVCSITAITTASSGWMADLFPNVLLAGFAALVPLYVVGLVIALVVAYRLSAPSGAAIWLDYRWSFVQAGCAFSGLLTTIALTQTLWAAPMAIAPVLMAEFALNWPELDRQARIDAKTGLANARHWEDRSRDLLSAAALHQTPVAVAMVDIDHFKTVNDTYGHLIGDHVLEGMSAVLRTQVGASDVVGRFGGEEFVITLIGVTAAEAAATAERIRIAVANQKHASGPLFRADRGSAGGSASDTFTITCTIGFATTEDFGFDLSAMLGAADAALAAGKSSGRDTVLMADIRHGDSYRDEAAAGESAPGRERRVPGAFRVASEKRPWLADRGRETRRPNE